MYSVPRLSLFVSDFFSVLLLAIGIASISSNLLARDHPNIVVILADDIGVETVSAYGSEYPTPHIDSLADNGIRFDQGHATPVCTTTRTRLLAGTYNFKHYQAFAHLNPSLYTLPKYIRDAGYSSVVVGKWQMAGNMEYCGRGSYPEDLGFDEHLVWQLERSLKGSRYWQPTLTENGAAKTYCLDDFAPKLFNDYILDFIDRNHKEKLFIYYNPVLAHDPWTTTPDSLEADTPKEKFAGMMAYLDKMVGRLLDKLEEHEIVENTLIWFIGDNGTHPQITSLRHGKSVTGGKWKTKTNGTHVPFILQWKARLPRGIIKSDLVEVLDVYPTLAAAVGRPVPFALDGINLLPYSLSQSSQTREAIFMHYDPQWGSDYFQSHMPADRFIFDAHWKYYADGRFFNTQADPQEERDLAKSNLNGEAQLAYESLKQAFLNMKDGPLKEPYMNKPFKGLKIPEPDASCRD